jgi:hypothetical protein
MTMQAGEPTGTAAKARGLRLGGGAIASGAGIGALLTFMAQNADDVCASFIVWHFTLSVSCSR